MAGELVDFEFDESVEGLIKAVETEDMQRFAEIAAGVKKNERIRTMYRAMRRLSERRRLLNDLQTAMRNASELAGI